MVGWHSWPETAVQLAALTRGLVDLERAAEYPISWAAPVDLDGLRAVIAVLTWKG